MCVCLCLCVSVCVCVNWLNESLCQGEINSDVDEETEDSVFDIVSPLQTEGQK